MENAPNTEKAPVSMLSQARIAAGLSLQQLADVTRIPSRYLQALESHDYDHFPSNLFAIGYLRNCAELLDVDSNSLLDDYDIEKLQKASKTISIAEHTETSRRYFFNLEKYQLKWLLCSFVAAFVVILTIFLFLVGQNFQHNDELVDHREQYLAKSVFTDGESIIESADLIASERAAVKPERPKDTFAQSKNTLMDELIAIESSLATDQDSALIELRFKGISWVDLTDARGQRVYRDLAKKGSNLAFFVEVPLELLLGDARQVEVFLNREPFAIESYRDDNSVRLTIGTP
ncbi:MAG: hypothetical protein CL691_01950 [Cellvibrionales bacterium]|nr:hypothetical protein [Cellvibrionales bacterium]|tara:strand:- start:8382 stop:9251 length:870 start_codon:yes stop_codon:yes gene_type:complete